MAFVIPITTQMVLQQPNGKTLRETRRLVAHMENAGKRTKGQIPYLPL